MSDLSYPKALTPGARIAILSPAGPVLASHLTLGAETLRQWGYAPVILEQTTLRNPARGYLAGTDKERASALTQAFVRPDIDAILCARGGYGAMRLLEHLDARLIASHPKALIGFSDVTALHLFLASQSHLCSLHGPVLKSFGLHPKEDPSASLSHLQRALSGERGSFQIGGLECVREGTVTGPCFGGNASIIQAMLASPYCPNLEGAILFLEDVTEPDYRLDRLLTSIRLAHTGIAGLVLGDFSSCAGVYMSEAQIPHLLRDLALEFRCPAAMRLPSGHASRNVAIPIGALATLNARAGSLTFHHDCLQ